MSLIISFSSADATDVTLAGGKGAKDFGTTVGSGTKDAAIGVKDKTGHGLTAVGDKMEGKKKTTSSTTTSSDKTTSTENPK